MNYYLMKMQFPEAWFLFLGDFNCYKPDQLFSLSPQLRQLVHYNTYGDKVLDLIVTDMHTWYHPPVPSDHLLPNLPDEASPSDHLGNLLIPRAVTGIVASRVYRKIPVRQGGRKRCRTVALLRGTKAKRETQRRRKRRGREEKRKWARVMGKRVREGKKSEGGRNRGGRKGGRN